MVTVDNTYAGRLQLAESSAKGDQVRMHKLNQRPPQQKIEPDEGDQRRGIVKHRSGRFLHAATLLDEIRLQDLA